MQKLEDADVSELALLLQQIDLSSDAGVSKPIHLLQSLLRSYRSQSRATEAHFFITDPIEKLQSCRSSVLYHRSD